MSEKQTKQVGIRIPNVKVWDSFLEYVKNKHGTNYGVTGIELQNIILNYLEHPEIEDINKIEVKYKEKLDNLKQKVEAFDALGKKIKEHENIIEILQNENKEFQAFKLKYNTKKTQYKELEGKYNIKIDQHDKLRNRNDVLRNRFDHLQVRFNKCQEEQNKLEREVSYLRLLMLQIKKRSLFERVLNRLPEGLKELEEGREL